MAKQTSVSEQPSPAYKVVTVSELDELVYRQLVKEGAAKKRAKGEEQYAILDRDKARSDVVMPKVLNPLGKKGWVLVAVNRMECYVFASGEPVEYRVESPPELDRRAIRQLERQGHLQLSGFEGQIPAMEITDSSAAKIQNVLPAVLSEILQEGWQLCAINGPQLYFFSRPLSKQTR